MNYTFDWNDWFIIIVAVIFLCLFWPIRKYFPPVIIVIVWVFCIEYVASIDYFLLATPFKLYYFGDNTTYEAAGSLFHLVIYPCGALLLLYGYDKWKLYYSIPTYPISAILAISLYRFSKKKLREL